MEHKEQLSSMLKDLIGDRPEQAEVTLHNYIVAKMRDLAGFGATEQESAAQTEQE